jgi:hypothetical protein
MSKFNSRKKRAAVVLAAALVVAVGGGLAYAYWTGTGAGSGTATTGSAGGFDVATGDPIGDELLSPGGPSETVPFTVTNTGTGSQMLNSVVVTVANDDGSEWVAVPGCSSLDYSVGIPTFTALELAPNDTKTGFVTVTMNDLDSDQDACQTVDVPLYLVAS